MQTVSQTIENLVRQTPLVEEALQSGILNLTAYARSIRPTLEKQLMKDVSDGAIVMALKRLSTRLQSQTKRRRTILRIRDITVETGLTEYTFRNSDTMTAFHRRLLTLIDRDDLCMNFSQGIHETTILVEKSLEKKVETAAKGEAMTAKIETLGAITLRLPAESVSTPGVYYPVLKALAWHDINFVEVMSVSSELTIVLAENDLDRAFTVIKELVDREGVPV